PSGAIERRQMKNYWLPREEPVFDSLASAAEELRGGLLDYVDRTATGMTNAACLTSSGEDSRAILAALARRLRPDAITFVPSRNFDAQIVETCAQAVGATFRPVLEDASLLLDDLDNASRLIGS